MEKVKIKQTRMTSFCNKWNNKTGISPATGRMLGKNGRLWTLWNRLCMENLCRFHNPVHPVNPLTKRPLKKSGPTFKQIDQICTNKINKKNNKRKPINRIKPIKPIKPIQPPISPHDSNSRRNTLERASTLPITPFQTPKKINYSKDIKNGSIKLNKRSNTLERAYTLPITPFQTPKKTSYSRDLKALERAETIRLSPVKLKIFQ